MRTGAIAQSGFPSVTPSRSYHHRPGKQVDVYWDGDDRWYTAEVRRRKRQPGGSANPWQPGGALVHELYYPIDRELHWHDFAQVRLRTPSRPYSPCRPCRPRRPCLSCSHLQPSRRLRRPRRLRLIHRDRHSRRLLRRTTPTATGGGPAAGGPSSRVTRGRPAAAARPAVARPAVAQLAVARPAVARLAVARPRRRSPPHLPLAPPLEERSGRRVAAQRARRPKSPKSLRPRRRFTSATRPLCWLCG